MNPAVVDSITVFGFALTQGKLIFISLLIGVASMLTWRVATRSKRYKPSNPPEVPHHVRS